MEAHFSRKVVQQIAKLYPSSELKRNALTEREKQIVQRIARGMTNKEIAKELAISDKAVEKHISNVFEKWEVKSRVEVAARVVREGWG